MITSLLSRMRLPRSDVVSFFYWHHTLYGWWSTCISSLRLSNIIWERNIIHPRYFKQELVLFLLWLEKDLDNAVLPRKRDWQRRQMLIWLIQVTLPRSHTCSKGTIHHHQPPWLCLIPHTHSSFPKEEWEINSRDIFAYAGCLGSIVI